MNKDYYHFLIIISTSSSSPSSYSDPIKEKNWTQFPRNQRTSYITINQSFERVIN